VTLDRMDLRLITRDGIFSTADAARVGLDRNALKRLVRDGRCLRLTTGWYAIVVGQTPAREELHRLRSVAIGRQLRTRAALSHHSCLVVAGLPTFAADLETVHLTAVVPSSGGVSVVRRGVSVHRWVGDLTAPSPDTLATDSPRLVPVAWAAVQAGLVAGPQAFVVPADAALRSGRATAAELSRAADIFASHTGIGPVRAALSIVDARHESPGESRTAFVLTALGYELEAQVEIVVEGRLYRPDFRIRGTRVLVEIDGAVKYGDRRALFEEKQREDALRRAGWVVVRLVWADLADPQRVSHRVRAALSLVA
jgi:very-short-patch-repair endonuclease